MACNTTRHTAAALTALLATAGCGDSGGGPAVDLGLRSYDYLPAIDFAPPPPDLAVPPRPAGEHPPGAQVVHGGGPVLKHVDLVTVVWSGDANAQRRADFASYIVDSPYMDLMGEYGAGRGTAHGPYFIRTAPPAKLDDTAVGTLLRARIAAGDLPPPHADVLYMIYVDPSTESTYFGGRGCIDYGGYHSATSSGIASPNWMAYAIIPACTMSVDEETSVVSHELVEAVTDPRGGNGWREPDIPYGEVGDLCTGLDTSYTAAAGDGGAPATWTVTRFWSAKAAADPTQDPCVPAPPPPYAYFNAAFEENIFVVTQDQSGKGTATLRIQPFAVSGAFNRISWRLYASAPGLTVSPLTGSGPPGSTQEVTFRVNAGAVPGTYTMWLTSSAKDYKNVWYGALILN